MALKARDGLTMRCCAVVERSRLLSLSSLLVHHSPLGLLSLLLQTAAPVLELVPTSLLPVRSYQGSAQTQQNSHVIFCFTKWSCHLDSLLLVQTQLCFVTPN